MLQDECLEYIREQYEEKNMVLGEFGEEVSAYTLYEDIFGDTTQLVPVVFIDGDTKHILPMSIDEALEHSQDRNDVLLGGCTYFNNWISKKSAKDIHAFIIDMDNVYSGTLLNALRQDWRTANGEELAMPTYIVNSGTGLHLYFVLDEPVPNYKSTTANLDKLYRALAVQQTTKRVYLNKQVQWFGQDFRMAGGLNKYEWKNTVFRVGQKWNIDKLAEAVGFDNTHFSRYGEPRKQVYKRKPPKQRKGWKSNRAFYDYSLRNCRAKTQEGNRYKSMCALSVIAWKCDVPQHELEKDLLSLLPDYNKGALRQIKEKEVYSAMKMYNPKAIGTQRESLENWQGWEYKPIKRNGQKQADHLEEARAIRDIRMKRQGKDWREGNGRKSQKELVVEWRRNHPTGKKVECIRDTGLSKPTVYRWWDEL